MINFIGCGSAFHTELGNNGAYMKHNNHLFLIDCGSATFERLQRFRLLDDVDHITVLLTHTHPDHVGSLGDLIFYSYYVIGSLSPRVTVLSPPDLHVQDLLTHMGVTPTFYTAQELTETAVLKAFSLTIEAIPTIHAPELACYGYLLSQEGTTIYYSGDSQIIPARIQTMLAQNELHALYQDTCSFDTPGNVHLSLAKLQALIPPERRSRVWCMHLDAQFSSNDAKALGFGVVEVKI
ncbi:metal-dependent hydrolase [Fictibacillus macauensis ZFHKF-1]|uniref:Metal-dependent hydrolase n=1 Tax=Fictibacillus macauensis ZFHKF-1 TaxID=1196324 RepID=I8AFV0_9BACL|nr:MBL fold metallo-hydrolase [Fictibacillus macauensis]EIT84264.1 metal-dependent hydrolase [Fictibacillus macauensis ZFHKF-1]